MVDHDRENVVLVPELKEQRTQDRVALKIKTRLDMGDDQTPRLAFTIVYRIIPEIDDRKRAVIGDSTRCIGRSEITG